jgi:hypothetical protein
MRNQRSIVALALAALIQASASMVHAQSASGTLTASFTNSSALVMVFNSDASGAALGNTGTSAATKEKGVPV